ncbi:hypothetical protein [Thermincola potens]|uniref:Uncharacterized protein n=1 Tax=Thermincola potens (strain JR) TaxID=635013 RepID=D5XB38_THEPJ|nr:hypothetical protein [Thermincola potens]ADG81358.1 hypothetical protein TherJR_0477 [Thermincola potens JR]
MVTNSEATAKKVDSNKGVAKAAGVIMIAMFLSRILGFVRDQAMTSQFGRTYITDAYIVLKPKLYVGNTWDFDQNICRY